jgi:diguanylate cyclase (GGDEF)-like protein
VLGLLAEILGDSPSYPWNQSVFFGLVDVFESTLAWRLMRSVGMSDKWNTLEDMGKFVLAGPLLATLAGGLLGGAAIRWLGVAHEGYLALVRTWWFGDALGQMVVTPLILLAAQPPQRLKVRLQRADWVVAVYTLVAIGILAMARGGMINGVLATPTLLLPAVLYLASRQQPVWPAAAVALIAIMVSISIAHGYQPFGPLPGNQEVMRGQEFILVMAVMGMGFSALSSELREHKLSLEARVAERTTQLLTVNGELARQVRTDALTELLNRRAFYEDAGRECERCNRYNRPLALLMFDLDHFKSVNDVFGHLVGDRALAHFAAVLARTARTSDTVARYGGEEFALLAPETDLESASQLAGRVRKALAESRLEVDGQAVPITVSIGIAQMLPDEPVERLLSRTDAALYEAKSAGRDRVRLAVG